MTEKLLQYIWQFQYFNRQQLVSTSGESIQVLFAGNLNTNQGPDFFAARIKIGATTLAGSVELHLKTSDWKVHGHSTDANYNNVVLHVVYQNDEALFHLTVLELEPLISNLLLERFNQLMLNTPTFACAATINQVKELTWMSWKERLVAERLTRKKDAIIESLNKNNQHWEQTFWGLLARHFGGTVNKDAFEELANSIPVQLLAKHKNSLHQLEALLLGQAGLLKGNIADEYGKLLQREYGFLQTKYNLKSVHTPVHFLRMRPQNFPTIRLAQLAMLVHNALHLFSKVIESTAAAEIKNLLKVTANDYWHYRFRFDEPAAYNPKKLGNAMIDTLMINAVVPILFAYGDYHKKEAYKLKAIQWLESIDAEENSITKEYKKATLKNRTAFDSQAFIELKTSYCDGKHCLKCSVGNALLKGL